MTFLYITLGISLVGIMMVLGNKVFETETGRRFMAGSFEKSDAWLVGIFLKYKTKFSYISVSYLKNLGHQTLTTIEVFFIKGFVSVTHFFARLGKILKGPHIPKNKGAVSFFLRSVDEVKTKSSDMGDVSEAKLSGESRQ